MDPALAEEPEPPARRSARLDLEYRDFRRGWVWVTINPRIIGGVLAFRRAVAAGGIEDVTAASLDLHQLDPGRWTGLRPCQHQFLGSGREAFELVLKSVPGLGDPKSDFAENLVLLLVHGVLDRI